MESKFNRKLIAPGVHFSTYKDTRFKMNRVDFIFTDMMSKETAAINAHIPAVISRTNDRYRTAFELNRKLAELYSAYFSFYAGAVGDMENIGLSIVALDNEFALDGENITFETTEVLRDCIFCPLLENGAFPEKIVEIQKKNQIESNDNLINDKAAYACAMAAKTAYENEPAANRNGGENEEVEKITPESGYKRYLEMLKTCNIEIMCIGSGDFSEVEKIFTEQFKEIERIPAPLPESKFSRIKSEPAYIEEKIDVSQSKMVMVFKTDREDLSDASYYVLDNLFGGDVSSKLFSVVREELSLCYYCYSGYNKHKGAITVQCGVDKENIEKAKSAIIEQLSEIAKGNFTDEDIEKVRLTAKNNLKSVGDREWSILNWYLHNAMVGETYTPDEYFELINNVSREEIIAAANAFILDTVYVLTSYEEAEDE